MKLSSYATRNNFPSRHSFFLNALNMKGQLRSMKQKADSFQLLVTLQAVNDLLLRAASWGGVPGMRLIDLRK